jgi:hypothetical protein
MKIGIGVEVQVLLCKHNNENQISALVGYGNIINTRRIQITNERSSNTMLNEKL